MGLASVAEQKSFRQAFKVSQLEVFSRYWIGIAMDSLMPLTWHRLVPRTCLNMRTDTLASAVVSVVCSTAACHPKCRMRH